MEEPAVVLLEADVGAHANRLQLAPTISHSPVVGDLAAAALPRIDAKQIENLPFEESVPRAPFQGLITSLASHSHNGLRVLQAAREARSIRIDSRALSAGLVHVHVCMICRLFPLMRFDRLDLGTPIDRVLVHCSKPVFSKFGASAAATHSGSSRSSESNITVEI